MATVYDKSSLFLAPSGVSNGTVFVQKPVPIYGSEQVTNGDFSQTGAELITNGDFATDSDWNKGAGWSISGGKLRAGDVDNINAFQAQVFTNGKTYKVTYTISDYTKGSVRFQFGGGGDTVNGQINSSNGVYTEYILATVNHTSARFRGQSTDEGFTGSIDNVSVKEVGQDWVQTETNWSFGNNKAIADGTSQGSLQQPISTIAVGSKYKINYTISDYVAGNIRFYFGGVFTAFESSNGSYSQVITSTSTDGSIATSIATPFIGSVTNISVQEVLSPASDFTFTRGSNLSATRVNEAQLIEKGRENLLVQSNQFDTTWNLSGASVTSGQSGYDGTNDGWLLESTITGESLAKQNFSTYSGVQTLSFFAKQGTASKIRLVVVGGGNPRAHFDLSDGTIHYAPLNVDTKITSVGNGWYRCNMTFNTGITEVRVQIVSANDGTNNNSAIGDNILIQDAQLEQGLAATSVITTGGGTVQAGLLENTPRLDYGGGATCPSLLLEPPRTNLVVQSEYFGDASWTKQAGTTVSSNSIISPSGEMNGAEVTIGTNSNASLRANNLVVINTENTFSVYAKKGVGSTSLKLDVGDAGITTFTLTDQWQRFEVTGTPTIANREFVDIALNGNQGDTFYVWGAQLEQGSYATSYIPTYGTSQTRGIDAFTRTGISSLINSQEGVLFVEMAALSSNTGTSLLSLSDGGPTNNVYIGFTSTTNQISAVLYANGVAYGGVNSSSYDVKQMNKIAVSYKTNEFKLFINGSLVGTDTSATMPNANTLNKFSSDFGQNSFKLLAKLNQAIIFPTVLSDLQLAILTGATTYETFDEMALALNYTVYE